MNFYLVLAWSQIGNIITYEIVQLIPVKIKFF